MKALLSGLLLALVLGAAQAEVAVPPLSARVTDLTGTLDPGQVSVLEQRLAAFEQEKGSQIAILILPSTAPEAIEQYSIRVAESWKIGRKGVDDGVILLVAKDDRKLRIEVGYGLEGALPDVIAKRIIEEVILPRFRAGDFYGGITDGVESIIGVIKGEPLPEPAAESYGGNLDAFFAAGFMAFALIGILLTHLFGPLVAGGLTGSAAGIAAWAVSKSVVVGLFAAVFVGIFFSGMRGGRGGTGGWSSGGGSSGGGGGFSGGGGSFGGGGASGGW